MKLKKISSFFLALIIIFSIAKLSTLTSKINSNSVNTADGSEADREQWLEYLANNPDAIAGDSTNVDISTSNKISISNSNDESTILTVTNYTQEVAQAALSGDTFAAPKTKRYTVLIHQVV